MENRCFPVKKIREIRESVGANHGKWGIVGYDSVRFQVNYLYLKLLRVFASNTLIFQEWTITVLGEFRYFIH